MTNIENNTDKRSQQLFTATGLTTQSAKDEAFKQVSAFSEEFIKKLRESFHWGSYGKNGDDYKVKYLKELSDMTALRQELGLRTAFNTVERLLNPSLSEYGVTTAFHKPYVQKYLDIFSSHFKSYPQRRRS